MSVKNPVTLALLRYSSSLWSCSLFRSARRLWIASVLAWGRVVVFKRCRLDSAFTSRNRKTRFKAHGDQRICALQRRG